MRAAGRAAAAALRASLTSFLGTTFALADDDVRAELQGFIAADAHGVFRGPYVRLRLPFRPAPDGWRAATSTNEARQDLFAEVLDVITAQRLAIRRPARFRGNWIAFASGPFGFWALVVTAAARLRVEAYLDWAATTLVAMIRCAERSAALGCLGAEDDSSASGLDRVARRRAGAGTSMSYR